MPDGSAVGATTPSGDAATQSDDAASPPDGANDSGAADDAREPTGFEAVPARASSFVAALAGVVAVTATALSGGALGALLVVVGVAVVALALRQRRGSAGDRSGVDARRCRRRVDRGSLLAGGGAVVAGALGGAVLPIVVATGAVVLCWDAATTALVAGDQLGSRAPTRRAEVTHIGATAGVVVVAAAALYGTYRLSRGGLPTASLLALVAGATALLLALRR